MFSRKTSIQTGRFNKILYPVMLCALPVLLAPGVVFGESSSSKIQEAISSYNRQEYEKAAKLFGDAHSERPENAPLTYNLGNSAYKLGKFDQAVDAYAKVMAGSPDLKQKSLYNMGNALYRMGKLDEAGTVYKKALELDPNDMDAKFNLEFVREQLKKRQQQKDKERDKNQDSKGDKNQPGDASSQSDKDNQRQNNEDKKDDRQSRQSQQNKNHNDPGKQSLPQNSSGQSPGKQDESRPDAQTDREKGSMTKEEAEQWLRSLAENPKNFARAQIEAGSKKQHARKGNDW